MPLQQLERKHSRGAFPHYAVQKAVLPKNIYATHGKRALDILASAIGLVLLSPLLASIACYIKMTSTGPVFYRQIRVGMDGGHFQILKFRSMVVDAAKRGLGITVSGDNRVTRVGRLLRGHKLDELPQLWNVLRGDMSLVGPRPELPIYVAAYTPEERLVLSVRPGITDPASLAYRHEEELLAGHEDPEQFYRSQILPDKLARSVDYLQTISLRGDLQIIIETVVHSFLFSCGAKEMGPEHRS
jgi:lipopolysaccharide/colanic/teichoic acid biosynthesis glycosyltransferase